jgi:DnaK suppressor protein
MTGEEKTELIEILKFEIDKVLKRLEEIKEFTAPVSPDDAVGRISRMDAINNKSIFEASEHNMKLRLEQLNQTIKITHDADFGLCNTCRQSISFERLKIRPEIRLCANCMKK